MRNDIYPMMITRADGARVIVNDHLQHSAHAGAPHGVDGLPLPPPDSGLIPPDVPQSPDEPVASLEMVPLDSAASPKPCATCNGEGWLMEREGEPCPDCLNHEFLGGTGIAGGELPESTIPIDPALPAPKNRGGRPRKNATPPKA